jgi:probable F420-dependent oxidoreductase
VKLGVVFPQIEMPADPIAIKDYAQTAEGLGYDYLLAYDHVLGANPDRPGGWQNRPYDYQDPFQEPFVTFGYLAGLTTTLEFVTGILILPQRQTALVAKQAAQVDVLSGGRLRLGIGIGWNWVEYEALGENFRNRGKRSEEQVELLQKLWTEPLVTFKGKYHAVSDAGLNPMPVQRPIPIWFGGGADVVLQRAARLGQGWMPNSAPREVLQEKIDLIRRFVAEAGRQPEEFGIDGRISLSNRTQAQWLADVKMWRELGATHLGVNTMGAGFTSVAEHLDAVRAFKTMIDNE